MTDKPNQNTDEKTLSDARDGDVDLSAEGTQKFERAVQHDTVVEGKHVEPVKEPG